MYIFNKKNIIKAQIAIARGKKVHDKHQDMKEKSMKRDIERALKRDFNLRDQCS